MTGNVTPEAYARTEALKNRLRACTSIAEVNATAKAIAREVAAHQPADPVGVIQLRNLVAYLRAGFLRDQQARGAS